MSTQLVYGIKIHERVCRNRVVKFYKLKKGGKFDVFQASRAGIRAIQVPIHFR